MAQGISCYLLALAAALACLGPGTIAQEGEYIPSVLYLVHCYLYIANPYRYAESNVLLFRIVINPLLQLISRTEKLQTASGNQSFMFVKQFWCTHFGGCVYREFFPN